MIDKAILPIIDIKGLTKSYMIAGEETKALVDANLEIFPGEFVVILGPSGCGKSTLLNSILGLEAPDSGSIITHGRDIYKIDDDEKTLFRQKNFGVVYQQPNWIKSLSVLENIAFPLDAIGCDPKHSLARAKHSLSIFSLETHARHKPSELSGGQQAKVAICRALIASPPIIIADEPTGNLDTTSSVAVMKQFEVLNRKYRRTIIMVTHNPVYVEYASKVVNMLDGKISNIEIKDLIYNGFDNKINRTSSRIII